jgi:hypothetical protein
MMTPAPPLRPGRASPPTSTVDRAGLNGHRFRREGRHVPALAYGRAVLIATSRFHHPAYTAEWVDLAIDAASNYVWLLLMDGLYVANSRPKPGPGR